MVLFLKTIYFKQPLNGDEVIKNKIARIETQTSSFLYLLSRSIHIIPQQLVRPVAASMHPRLALSRLQILEQLILSHGISTDKNRLVSF